MSIFQNFILFLIYLGFPQNFFLPRDWLIVTHSCQKFDFKSLILRKFTKNLPNLDLISDHRSEDSLHNQIGDESQTEHGSGQNFGERRRPRTASRPRRHALRRSVQPVRRNVVQDRLDADRFGDLQRAAVEAQNRREVRDAAVDPSFGREWRARRRQRLVDQRQACRS